MKWKHDWLELQERIEGHLENYSDSSPVVGRLLDYHLNRACELIDAQIFGTQEDNESYIKELEQLNEKFY